MEQAEETKKQEQQQEASEQQGKNEDKVKVKCPKGTRDFGPQEMCIRRKVFDTITKVFLRHGAVEIDTPVFELKETLKGKYGEDEKLIYDLQDQGGELLSLRYDLTVPFSRYLASKKIRNLKRFHIAKVYRRDQPNVKSGRFREFYQCDFDIAGKYDKMIPDAEVIKVVDEILNELSLDKYIIKINSRKILDSMIEVSGAPKDKFKTICSSIDKLDKLPWNKVEEELISKGISQQTTDQLNKFVLIKGNPENVLNQLKANNEFVQNKIGQEGIQEMELLFNYLKQMQCLTHVIFDLSLARGLDYYTGMIYETVLQGANVGSISGGGRYDDLIGQFSGEQIPSVGGSIGIERIFTIIEERQKKGQQQQRQTETEVIIGTIGQIIDERLQIASELWNNQIKAEISYQYKPSIAKQIKYGLDQQIPFMILIGEDEIKQNNVQLNKEVVARADLIKILKNYIQKYYEDLQNNKVIFEKPKGEKEKEKEEK